MKVNGIFKLAAGTATIGLALGGAYAVKEIYKGPNYQPIDAEKMPFESCVADAVKKHLPDAKGGIVPAQDRAENYQKFGDHVIFRQRGLSRVDSVEVVNNSSYREDLKGYSVFLQTRTAAVVLPSSIFGTFADRLEERHQSYVDTSDNDLTGGSRLHKPLVQDIQACANKIKP